MDDDFFDERPPVPRPIAEATSAADALLPRFDDADPEARAFGAGDVDAFSSGFVARAVRPGGDFAVRFGLAFEVAVDASAAFRFPVVGDAFLTVTPARLLATVAPTRTSPAERVRAAEDDEDRPTAFVLAPDFDRVAAVDAGVVVVRLRAIAVFFAATLRTAVAVLAFLTARPVMAFLAVVLPADFLAGAFGATLATVLARALFAGARADGAGFPGDAFLVVALRAPATLPAADGRLGVVFAMRNLLTARSNPRSVKARTGGRLGCDDRVSDETIDHRAFIS